MSGLPRSGRALLIRATACGALPLFAGLAGCSGPAPTASTAPAVPVVAAAPLPAPAPAIFPVEPALAPAPAAPELAPEVEDPAVTAAVPATAMAPVRVSDAPIQSFGFTVEILGDPATRRVRTITVVSVWPNGSAGRAGLRPGSSIIAIDGRPVADFAASLAKGSALNRILMNKVPGDRVRLVVVRDSRPPQTILVVQGGGAIPGLSL